MRHLEIVSQCKCPAPEKIEDTYYFCVRHQCEKTPHNVRLCQTSASYFRAWEEGRGPGQHGKDNPQPSTGRTKKRFAYKTSEERLAMVEAKIASVCRTCKQHQGVQIAGQPPIDICDCAGCSQKGKQDIRKMNYCPRRKWSLLVDA